MAEGRGFTLVEVLVALGLLVMIAALALPVALTNTTTARARTAERMLTLAPAVARGEAQRLGRPVALVLLPSDDGEALRLAVVREPDPESQSPADQRADPGDIATWPTVDQPRELPEGTRLWTGELEELEAIQEDIAADVQTPSALEAAFADRLSEALPDEPQGQLAEPTAPVVLAWFLSDGSALAGDAAAVRLADGRVVRLRVRALTGTLELDFRSARATSEVDPTGEDERDALEPAGPDDVATMDDGASASGFGETVFDELGFDELGFDELEFDELEFDERGFDDLGSRLTGDEPDEPGRRTPRTTTSRQAEEQAEGQSETPETNPEPPQPR